MIITPGLWSPPSSPLDLHETSQDQGEKPAARKPRRSPHEAELHRRAVELDAAATPATAIETAFRHRGWAEDRKRVKAALIRAGVSPQRLERFVQCGGRCRVQYSAAANRHRLVGQYCRDRFCIPCCNARSVRVQAWMLRVIRDDRLRFITLTLRASDDTLRAVHDRLIVCFRALREESCWKNAIKGGAAVVEITRGKYGTHWHVHLHVLVVGGFLDKRELKDAWLRTTGDSFIVDIRSVGNANDAVRYVAKYATKGWAASVLRDPDATVECIESLRGRRLLITFGTWYRFDDPGEDEAVDDWHEVGRLGEVFFAALDRQQWAMGVFRGLGVVIGGTVARPWFVELADDS